jgi:hypothetical protein
MTQSTSWLELYKCAVLTIIAVALVALYLKIPVPFTYKNLSNKKVEAVEIPLVRIEGGHVSAH